MNLLSESFRQRTAEEDAIAVIGSYIDKALAPWKAGGARIHVMDRMPSYFYTVLIEIELLPNLPFEYDVVPDLSMDLNYAHEIGEKAFQFYRNRPTIPVDDHIILGED